MIPIPPTALGHLGDHEPQPVISSTRHPPPTPASHLAPNRPRAHREPGDAPPAFPSQSRKPAIECMHCMHFPQPKRAHTSSLARKHTPGTHPFTPVSPGNSTKTAQFPLFSPLLNCSIGARPAPYASTAWAGTPRHSQDQAPGSRSRSTITASKNPSASNPSFTSSLIHFFTYSLLHSFTYSLATCRLFIGDGAQSLHGTSTHIEFSAGETPQTHPPHPLSPVSIQSAIPDRIE
jgi:hypothetical protein